LRSRAKETIVYSPKPDTTCLVFSDVHLSLEGHKQSSTEEYLVSKIKLLGAKTNACLILNGDIFELWAYPHGIEQIISKYQRLTKAIVEFSKAAGHNTYFVVGNHDDTVGHTDTDQEVIYSKWGAQICLNLDIDLNGQVIHVEHGHQFDPYNRLEDPMKPGNITRGQRIVQTTMPKLKKHFPNLADGISDVVDRRNLPVFGLSRFAYRIYLPLIVPVFLAAMVGESFLLQSIYVVYWGLAIVVVSWVLLWLLVVLAPWLTKIFFGSGGDIDEAQIDKYLSKSHYNALVIGHTHRGMIIKTKSGWYANSGCNDPVQLRAASWLGITLFNHYSQNSCLWLNLSKSIEVRYEQTRRPIIDQHRLEKLFLWRKPNQQSNTETQVF